MLIPFFSVLALTSLTTSNTTPITGTLVPLMLMNDADHFWFVLIRVYSNVFENLAYSHNHVN